MDDRELGRLLRENTPTPPPSAEALHAIVSRSRRRGRATLGVAILVLLVARGRDAAPGGRRHAPSPASVRRAVLLPGLHAEQAAAALGIEPSTVRVQLHRARTTLRQVMAETARC